MKYRVALRTDFRGGYCYDQAGHVESGSPQDAAIKLGLQTGRNPDTGEQEYSLTEKIWPVYFCELDEVQFPCLPELKNHEDLLSVLEEIVQNG